MSNLMNKVKEVVPGLHPDPSTTTTSTTTSTTNTPGSANVGPHSSSAANKADPRIDSDLDGSRTVGAGSTTTGHPVTGTTAGTTTTGVGSTTAGPHGSSLLNKADPRVDSNLDGSRTVGGNTTATTSAHTPLTGTTGTGTGIGGTTRTHGTFDGTRDPIGTTGTAGTRVGGNTSGTNPLTTGTTGTLGTHGTTGTTHGTHGTTGTTTGVGSTTGAGTTGTGVGTGASSTLAGVETSKTGKTAGPHSSDMMNKLDPRVDSDLSSSTNTSAGGRTSGDGANEPLDALKHTPSQFQKVHGDPIIEHDNPQHSLAGRHGARQGSKVGSDIDAYGSGAQ